MATKSTGGVRAARRPLKMVMPFGIQCDNCERQTKKGDTIWALKEKIGVDPSLEVNVYRFQSKCISCVAMFSIVTDPGRYDYVLEAGAKLIPKKF
ncbi:hypothetical protein CASFOL_011084 [Castilleja foliolosa]|uniref:Uncharacterized protein n=1 Tax=Castilleja foliolosa TaxID=1961234 RepID=A0ABD3DY84_9LAMI